MAGCRRSAAATLAFGVEILQIVDQRAAGAAVIGKFLFENLALAPQVAGDGEARLNRGKQFGFLLHYLGKALFDKTI